MTAIARVALAIFVGFFVTILARFILTDVVASRMAFAGWSSSWVSIIALYSVDASIAAFAGGYAAARVAKLRETALATFAVLLPYAIAFPWETLGNGPIELITNIQFFGPQLLLSLLFGISGGNLARRHRLRREAQADQAIIDTF